MSQSAVEHISMVKLGSIFGDITLGVFAQLSNPKMREAGGPMEEIIITCPGRPGAAGGQRIPCPTQEQFPVPKFFSCLVLCDACRETDAKEAQIAKMKSYWESICPPSLRDTDKEHAGFPKAQYAATASYAGTESLLLYGDTRMGKTRLAMLLLKRCLTRYSMHVGILWPEVLKSMKKTFAPLEELTKWGRYDLLLMDDALLAAAMDARLTDWLKDLIDYRMRHKRHCIITSQIGSADYKQQSNKFAEATGADAKLIDALCARVSEICTVVPFVSATPKSNEEAF